MKRMLFVGVVGIALGCCCNFPSCGMMEQEKNQTDNAQTLLLSQPQQPPSKFVEMQLIWNANPESVIKEAAIFALTPQGQSPSDEIISFVGKQFGNSSQSTITDGDKSNPEKVKQILFGCH